MTLSLKNKLEKIIEELYASPFVNVIKSKIGNPVDPIMYKWAIDTYSLNLSKSLADLYHHINGCNIEWECDLKLNNIKKFYKDDDIIKGRIRLYPLETLVSSELQLSDLEEFDIQEIEDIKNFKVFDYNDDSMKVGFLIEQSILNEEMYYFMHNADGFSKYPETLSEYLETMVLYRGFQGWVYNHIFHGNDLQERMKHYLYHIFNK